MIKDLFEFPTALVDGENEERKQRDSERLALDDDDTEYDIVYGVAMYPYYDFIGIEDRWLPTKESFEGALKGKFDACVVKFANCQPQLVPWSRKKFLKELKEFTEKLEGQKEKEDQTSEMTILRMTPEQLSKIFNLKVTDDGENKQLEEGTDTAKD